MGWLTVRTSRGTVAPVPLLYLRQQQRAME
eukprot:COSAG06_NODE_11160_length_1553_cov_6.087345_1_plen_29_part_10